jgi:hypothetical protein
LGLRCIKSRIWVLLLVMGELTKLSWRVIDNIQKQIVAHELTDAEVIARSGMPRSTFYRKMAGTNAMTTDDIEAIARAIGVDPFTLFQSAPANVTSLGSRRSHVGDSAEDEVAVSDAPDASLPKAAKRGTRKADQ